MRTGNNQTRLQGFTLIEVLVTLMIFAIGLAGFAGMQTTALREAVDSQQRSLAAWRAQELIDRIRANPGQFDTFVTQVGAYSCGVAPAKICADHFASNAKVNAATCSATEMATYDVWEIMCAVADGAESSMVEFAASLSCSVNPCAEDADLTLSMSWTSQAARGNKIIAQASGGTDPFAQTLVTVFRP